MCWLMPAPHPHATGKHLRREVLPWLGSRVLTHLMGARACLPLRVQGEAVSESAAQFIVNAANAWPGEVVVLALAALTNVALALHLDPELPDKLVRGRVCWGGRGGGGFVLLDEWGGVSKVQEGMRKLPELPLVP
jgi:hypothetical protein